MAKAKKLKSGAWNIRAYDYTDENGKLIMRSFTAPTKAEAEYMAAEFARNKKQKKKNVPDLTVSDAIQRYIDLSATLSPTTVQAYKKIQKHAFQGIMPLKVSDITDNTMQAAINAEAMRTTQKGDKVLSPKTVKNEYGLISAALKSVCNVTYNIRLPKVQRNVEMLPDPAQVFEAVKDTPIELPALLALWMGLRLSEIRGLKYSSIKDGYLYVNQVVVDVGNEAIEKQDAKTAASKRRLKIPPYIIMLINSSIAEQKALKSDSDGSDGYICPQSRFYIYYHFEKAMSDAGIDLTFHGLRHLYASVSLSILGLPSKSVQVSGGWATSSVMDRVYSQSFNDLQDRADEARNGYFENMANKNLKQTLETRAEKP